MRHLALSFSLVIFLAGAVSAQGIVRLINRTPGTIAHYVDINTATQAELMSLPAIGQPEAERIIKSRPYTAKQELRQRGVLTADTYKQIEQRITAIAPPPKK